MTRGWLSRIRLEDALKGCIRFYEACRPHRAAFVTATFEQVTSDLGGVIERINQRFGIGLKRFEHTEANVERVFAALDRRNERINKGATPMNYRSHELKEEAKQQIGLDPFDRLLQRCRVLFQEYREMAEN